MDASELWTLYRRRLIDLPELGFRLDVSRMNLPDDLVASAAGRFAPAFDAMEALEGGALANRDEERQVGHYWLRAPELAPTAEIRDEVVSTLDRIRAFAAEQHEARRFERLLVVGIGGSALGPQFVADALGGDDRMRPAFLDNTDPEGIDRVLAGIGDELDRTLAVVISKSGGTPETRNGMLEARAAYEERGLDFGAHAVAVTGAGSALDRYARESGFLARFPMPDWVGGRTSETSVVGLLPAALQGIDVDEMLRGAAAMDRATRERDAARNPAAMLALAWHHAGGGRGDRDMVVLPYCDRLLLFSRYLQQLVMESLGKKHDRSGAVVHQGLAVYGNKGSTDQHAYVQQLRDGRDDFFLTFVEVLHGRRGPSIEVEPGVTSGDYLAGFLLGTRDALYESGRPSLTVTIERVSPAAVGMLVALFERAVGLYAELIDVNAYHQPGVEAGKKAAAGVLDLQRRLLAALDARTDAATAERLAADAGAPERAETAFQLLERLARDPSRDVERTAGDGPWNATYRRRRA